MEFKNCVIAIIITVLLISVVYLSLGFHYVSSWGSQITKVVT